jgi:NADH:ubiquinone oxidoreductase subunit 2 (subunit N)
MQGLGRMMPITTLALSVSLLGLGGVPGTNGFISKFILFSSALEANLSILAIIGVLNSTLSMAYYLRIIITLLSTKTSEGTDVKEAPFLMVAVPVVMTLLIIAFGVCPDLILSFASNASKALIEGLANYIGVVIR